MSLTKEQARHLIKAKGLRATAPRLAVLCILSTATHPLSYSEVIEKLGKTDWDPATIYRNLVKLKEAKLATVVSRAEGMSRYALARTEEGETDHKHPHFLCDDCGKISCLPNSLVPQVITDSAWAKSISKAMIQLRGECPDCLDETSC